ncbi:MAG: T9SS type A sorting domain-containing protein [Ferruginibacter sp.]
MKKAVTFLLLLLFTSITSAVFAQPWLEAKYLTPKTDSSLPVNFYEIQKAFQLYEQEQRETYPEKFTGENEFKPPFKGYKNYKRWEWFNEQRTYPTGEFPSVKMVLEEYDKFFRKKNAAALSAKQNITTSQVWENLASPNAPAGSYAGTGRVNCMAFMPGDNNTVFIGTACGGIWKSTNGGTTWTVLNTDQLPSLSITSICIEQTLPNTIYIATGDNFTGFPIASVLKQGHYSAGVFKSTDGGLNWQPAGMSALQSNQLVPQQMIIDPAAPLTLLIAGNTGIWRTIDGGNNWTMVRAGNFFSIEFKPLDHNVVYATDGSGLWRSTDNGLTWSFRGGGYPNAATDRVSLAVTPANVDYVYLWGKTAGFKRSIDGGNTIDATVLANPESIALPYGYVDRAIGVSNTDKDIVIVGGLTTAKTINGGVNAGTPWATTSEYVNHLAPNYFHADIKKIVYEPGSGSRLYALHDGGIAFSADNGATWTDKSNGLQIAEIYKIANSHTSADTIYYGAQDIGTNRWDATNTSVTLLDPGDGFQCLVDPNNPMIIFTSKQLGNVLKSINGGQNFVSASPGQMLWNCPIKMNPLNSQTMYAGCTAGVKKSTVGGTQGSYVNLSAAWLDWIYALDISRSDTNYIYAASHDSMIRSVNGGTTWSYITAGLPVAFAAITDIIVSSGDRRKIYVTFSGYSANNKVFMSVDSGANWINYSGSSLPNVPVNCITYVAGSNDEVYIGTDFGVFYRDAASSDWVSYNNGLPNVVINDLEIYYPTRKLRAGTYGRGVWEVDLNTVALPVTLISFTGHYNKLSNTNDLAWSTAQETNNNYFEIMKSANGIDFTAIGMVNSPGNSSGNRNYSYQDKDPVAGLNFYRLKQVDLDGQAKNSGIINIYVKKNAADLILYPNPASSNISIEYADGFENTRMDIIDVLGVQVTDKTMVHQETNRKINVDISQLPPGIYVLKLTGKSEEINFSKSFSKF